MLKVNEASWDRIVRVVLGVVLLVLGLTGVVSGVAGIVLDVLGAVLLVTGIVGFCPLYAISGIKTRRV
jgi:hypothetical protein